MKSGPSPWAKIPPPAVFACALAGAALITNYEEVLQTSWFRAPVAAVAVGVAALALMAWAAVEFRRYRTTILPLRQPSSLLERGPFCFSRNPLYLGLLAIACVPWLWSGQLGLLLAPAVFFAFVNGIEIPYEEAKLREIFGDAYNDYARRVRRWI